jgi:hypothetical protein
VVFVFLKTVFYKLNQQIERSPIHKEK